MASKLVCDRCGKAITQNAKSWMKYKVVYGAVRILLPSDLYDKNEIECDLCKECTESFLEWVNQKWEE